ncbi:MAG TPA: prolyl aminopeptidase [Candidatus Competibacteraceae bacterium]|nr:MAG: prolyl aminopeptidase [Candidatus Competibacteraceae bacterium]HQC72020.1 prolyl aminopeptidase [Candidatus Competibacteraceae bacterium]
MRVLFPDIKPYATSRLAVDARHTLYIEECGNPEGLPVLFLHGGPGGGCEPLHRRFFDPQRYRIVLFDQRGSGQSTPHAELRDNTTWDLVADIERLRTHLGIERWVVFGGSWGSTLALAYAETHPQQVLGLILRGIFLCRDQDIHWFYQQGASRLFPDLWEHFLAPIPLAERDDLVQAYYRRLTGANELERLRAAKAWSVWEGSTLSLEHNSHTIEQFSEARRALSLARIECHYFVNQCFLEPDQLVRDAGRLRGIPGVIVHGRYDVICPLDGAWALHQAWPEAELRIITPAGHAASEPGIVDALVTATQAFADRLA